MKKVEIHLIIIFTIIGLSIPFGTVFLIIADTTNKINRQTTSNQIQETNVNLALADLIIESKYPKPLETPKIVKGIYLTGYSFVNKKTREGLVQLANETEINAFVIDIKDASGRLMFTPESELLKKLPVSNMSFDNEQHKEILADLQQQGIYTIARITTFQDSIAAKTFPDLALKNTSGGVWTNWQGISWLDMTNPGAWEISVEEAKEAVLLGFDEIQFDYIRFPSDGNIRQIKYFDLPTGKKKYEALTDFYKFARENLDDTEIPLSVDLFGLTYEHRENPEYDMNIGQRLIDAGQYFDYISPMVYPSHYPDGYMGFANPALHPYAVVDRAMKMGNQILSATSTIATSRPWLQDFDIGADYTAPLVRAQIDASEENGVTGWLLWNPYNRYTAGALKKEDVIVRDSIVADYQE